MKKLSVLPSFIRQRGISLIEGVLYLVIALAVIVGGIVFFQQAQLSNKISDTSRAAVGLSSQVRSLFISQRSFGNQEMASTLIRSGGVPSNFLNADGDAIFHPHLPRMLANFGPDPQYEPRIEVYGNGPGFALKLNNLSKEACLRLGAVGEGGDGPLGTGIRGLTIDGWLGGPDSTITFSDTFLGNPELAAPVSAADLAPVCWDTVNMTVWYNR